MINSQCKNLLLKKSLGHYTHFDYRRSLKKIYSYISNPPNIVTHGFYPLIHYQAISHKIKNGAKQPPKTREIYYASHIDAWIYRYYSSLLNEKYNKSVKFLGLDDVAVAYRTNLGKNNIDFANDAFSFLTKHENCHIIIGDFTNFFDNLEHKYLKEKLCQLLQVPLLPADWYSIFKNVTKYSYCDLIDLMSLKGYPDTKKARMQFNKLQRIFTPQEFRSLKSKLLKSHNSSVGIPQGLPISAVLANIYMLDADKLISDTIKKLGGKYLRYSDDFIVCVPKEKIQLNDLINFIFDTIKSIPNLILSQAKTKVFEYANGEIFARSPAPSNKISNYHWSKSSLVFLGFDFDGRYIRLKDRTISRYYIKLYRKIKTIIKCKGITKNKHKITCKVLYDRYTQKGSIRQKLRHQNKSKSTRKINFDEGNFLDYIYRAKSRLGSKFIEKIALRHMGKIKRKLNDCL